MQQTIYQVLDSKQQTITVQQGKNEFECLLDVFISTYAELKKSVKWNYS